MLFPGVKLMNAADILRRIKYDFVLLKRTPRMLDYFMDSLTHTECISSGLVVVDGVCYLIITDYLLCVCAILAEVRNRLEWGSPPFAEQTADDRASGDFSCTWTAFLSRGICLLALPPSPFWEFLRASKALRKPLTTSGWTRPEIPSG
uniref:Uncharacterized protein n=1 Tax=Heterorhabditis bacteriophora TaxID=37862 RepID=A0A1I7X7F3_HETBA